MKYKDVKRQSTLHIIMLIQVNNKLRSKGNETSVDSVDT